MLLRAREIPSKPEEALAGIHLVRCSLVSADEPWCEIEEHHRIKARPASSSLFAL
jgi:hypothetical protein